MTTALYKVATGHGHAVGAQTDISPQPATIGLEYTRRQYAASGIVIDEYAFIAFHWSMIETESQYQTLLGTFGLSASVAYANVSIYLQDHTYAWITRDGIAVRPFIGQDGSRNNYFLRDFTIVVKNLMAQ